MKEKSAALEVDCCIAGGGPAGMMLGFLLARSGVKVTVLEKHADFLRDFRGDTIHPSTLEIIGELGLLDDFLRRPHQEFSELRGLIGETEIVMADFSHLKTRCRFIALMPQWDFLDFLAERAERYPTFTLRTRAEAVALIESDGTVVGVRATTPDGPLAIRASLVVGADGRHSALRERAGLEVIDIGAPIDVLWFRFSKRAGDPPQTLGRFVAGRIFIMLDRGTYWQCALVIAKGGFDAVRARGLPALRSGISGLAPVLNDRVDELREWDDVRLLTVAIDRLRRWYRPGLLCIGDAAHAMSPMGGVGINLAIQDAVAAANALAGPLASGSVGNRELAAVQRRREFPTRVTQALQVFMQKRLFAGGVPDSLAEKRAVALPLPLRLLRRWPVLRRIPAYVVGVGVRPEHVRTPEAAMPSRPPGEVAAPSA